MVNDDRKCENCKYSESMYIAPKSDRMLCKKHQIDVNRWYCCTEWKSRITKEPEIVVTSLCHNCGHRFPFWKKKGWCKHCGVYFCKGKPMWVVNDEF